MHLCWEQFLTNLSNRWERSKIITKTKKDKIHRKSTKKCSLKSMKVKMVKIRAVCRRISNLRGENIRNNEILWISKLRVFWDKKVPCQEDIVKKILQVSLNFQNRQDPFLWKSLVLASASQIGLKSREDLWIFRRTKSVTNRTNLLTYHHHQLKESKKIATKTQPIC